MPTSKVTPFLWFDTQAEEAMNLRLMNDPDSRKSQAVVQAMLKMDQIIIADLQKAYDSAQS